MTISDKFILTESHKKEGVTLTIYWAGGMSQVTTWMNGIKNVQKVSKSVQSIHRFTPQTIKHWLSTPISDNYRSNGWSKKSESLRVIEHIMDYIHDAKMRGIVVNYTIE